jgi:predicted Ser/Thr protein kinase
MNKCPQCLAVLPKNEEREECRVCGLNFSSADFAATLETRKFNGQSMNTERWQKIKHLFDVAQELEPKEREKFLAKACGGDIELRREIEKLLASFEGADSFLENPVAGEVASMFEDKKTLAAHQTTGEMKNGGFVAGTILANRYRIIGLLGKGGMGEVFKAEDIKLNQTVALKFLPDKLEKDKAALNRFHAEVRNARQVSHANVCRVFDIGEVENRHFLSMEFIDGDDLSSLLRRIGRLPSDKAIEIARQLCFGLAAIHEAGILHRDLKPANVIIDSKGKARITDFGIAGLEEELKTDEIRVGTPAYMSPEQITGRAVSPKSDIYSLGLVLYEIFTGRQAFQSDSMPELLQKQQTTAPINPSEFLKEINPLVERAILQCLEKNASERPKSALQVAMMLPGGNPLEAAILAGETPSPEMVAAAPKKGALKPTVAVTCLSSVVLLFAFIVFFAGNVKDHEWIPLEKPPEVLAERADSIVKKLGYGGAAVDADYGFGKNGGDYYGYAAAENAPQRWERMRSGQPAIIYFWHRTSPRYLAPLQYASVWHDDPPLDVAGMTKVITDVRGRLLEFQAVPPQVKDKQTPTGEIDWATLFTEAGLDIRGFRPAESNWTSPVFADAEFAWEGAHVDHAEIPVRIEAAAYQGKPVYFQIVAPWDKPVRQEETFAPASSRAAGVIFILVYLSIVAAGVFLARRNVRQGRGDTKGAFKITMFVFLTTLAANLLTTDHIPDLAGERRLLFITVATTLFYAIVLALLYLALEPFVRRRWANLIISWNRLLAGDFRDPLVGRDILIGGMLGLGHTSLIYLAPLSQQWLGLTVTPNPSLNVSFLQNFKHLLAGILLAPGNAISFAFAPLLLLVLLMVIFRKQWLAIAALWAIYFLILGLFFASDGHWVSWLWTSSIATLSVICVSRFGLLALISFHSFFHLSFHTAITANVSSWYFGNTIFAGVILLGLAIYGFYTSLAGQPIIQGKLFQEDLK